MKRKMFFRLAAACLVAVSTLISCTKDYGADISALKSDVAGLRTDVDAIKALIASGSVITNVETLADGVKVTLSDGKNFTIKNGKDGAPGKDGSVVEIRNGVWYIDGQSTGLNAQGPKGDTGATGATGAKGDAGDYYIPCVDKTSENYGYWIKVDGATDAQTVTAMQWLPKGTLTAVWDEESEVLTIHNVEGAEDGVVEINLSSQLKSLALIPTLWDASVGMPIVNVYYMVGSKFFEYNGGKWSMDTFRQYWWTTTNLSDIKLEGDTDNWAATIHGNHLIAMAANTLYGMWGYEYGYVPEWDVNSDKCYLAQDDWFGTKDPATYAQLKKAVNDWCALVGEHMANLESSYGFNEIVDLACSDIKVSYRVNPSEANLDDYKFALIDRSLDVTYNYKADGDSRNSVAQIVGEPKISKDQIDINAKVDFVQFAAGSAKTFLKAYLDQFTKYLGVYNEEKDLNYISDGTWGDHDNYLNNICYNEDQVVLVALEASKNGKGAEAVVSDYVALNPVPVDLDMLAWDYKAYKETDGKYRLATNLQLGRKDLTANDVMKYTGTYDVASHIKYLDPYYGTAEELGFNCKYVFKTFNDYFEDEWKATKYTQVSEAGVVSVKDEYKNKESLPKYIGDLTCICIDVVDAVTGQRYNAYPYFYILRILPDDVNAKNITVDLGTVNYSQLTAEGIRITADDLTFDELFALNLNCEKNQIKDLYESIATGSKPAPAGVKVGGYYFGNTDSGLAMFDTLTNMLVCPAETGAKKDGEFNYVMVSKDTELYPTVNITVKYAVINDIEMPVLNPDYVLYNDEARTELNTSDKWADVDSIIRVKGKLVGDKWKAQSSVKEHLLDYTYPSNNDGLLTMVVSKRSDNNEGAKIFNTADPDSYKTEEIISEKPWAIDEEYRDYLVDMNLTLVNRVVMKKTYIVRFENPFIVTVNDVDLYTHTADACVKPLYFVIKERNTNEIIAFTAKGGKKEAAAAMGLDEKDIQEVKDVVAGKPEDHKDVQYFVTSYAEQVYGKKNLLDKDGITITFSANPDASFGDNLTVGNYQAIWDNDGADLQVNKTTPYFVTITLKDMATYKPQGLITVHKTSESPAQHEGDTSAAKPEV